MGTNSAWERTATLRLLGSARGAWAPSGEERGGGILCCYAHSLLTLESNDVNKDWTCKDKDKDLNLVLKESLRTRTSLTVTSCKLQPNLQSLSSNNNEHKVKIHNI